MDITHFIGSSPQSVITDSRFPISGQTLNVFVWDISRDIGYEVVGRVEHSDLNFFMTTHAHS